MGSEANNLLPFQFHCMDSRGFKVEGWRATAVDSFNSIVWILAKDGKIKVRILRKLLSIPLYGFVEH